MAEEIYSFENFFIKEKTKEELQKEIDEFINSKIFYTLTRSYPEINSLQGLLEIFLSQMKLLELNRNTSQDDVLAKVEIHYKSYTGLQLLQEKFPQMVFHK